jgi:hypothetical protein
MKKTAILLAALLMSSTAAHAGALGEATHSLSGDMTEQQVKQYLQNFPYTVSLETCGSDTPSPWQCKIFRFTGGTSYDDRRDELTVLLIQRFDGVWEVNSWF